MNTVIQIILFSSDFIKNQMFITLILNTWNVFFQPGLYETSFHSQTDKWTSTWNLL